MHTLTDVCKTTRQDRSYILSLIKKGRVEYAHDAVTGAYIVSLEDVLYHLEQVRLLRLGDVAIKRAKHERLMRNLGIPDEVLRTVAAKQVKVYKKSVKYAQEQ